MKKQKRIIKDPKVRGEWVESVFMARAGEHGLAVSKPWGDSKSFDFVVGSPGRFVGVQVKSTVFEMGGGYACSLKRNNKPYARGSFDFVAAYVIPEDAWYIIPAGKIGDKESLILCSAAKQAQYEAYREAWHLLKEASEVGVEESHPTNTALGGAAASEISEDSHLSNTAKGGTPGGIHPGNVEQRMEWVANRVRKWMEGSNVRPEKKDDEI